MVLKSIADKGKILHPGILIDVEVIDTEKGINNTGTFHYICRECDSTYFQDYENKEALLSPPTDKMMVEIALKNMLLMLS